jgi:hypothetical protein
VKKIVTGVIAALLGVALAAAAAAPASAAPNAMDTSAAIELTITDRADSGTGSPTVWAKDTFTRKIEVTTEAKYEHDSVAKTAPEVLCDVVKKDHLVWEYVAVVTDSGQFKTANNSAVGSPGAGVSLIKDAVGTFIGGATAKITAPAHWCSWAGDDYNGGTVSGELTGSTSQFLGKLFGKYADVDLIKWAWAYNRCAGTDGAEKWVNALTGNSGDIRGVACPSPAASPSASTSPAPAVSTSPAAATLPLTGAKTGTILWTSLLLLGFGVLVLGGLAVWNRRRMNGLTSAE